MSRIANRYQSAVYSQNLRSEPRTDMSDSDVIGAAGLAAKSRPLAIALYRLFAGDNRAVGETVQILTGMLVDKAWQLHRMELHRVVAGDISKAVLAWHRDGMCKTCGGHGYKIVGGKLGESRAVVSDAPCGDCRGTGKVLFDQQFAMELLELARWLRAAIEKEQCAAGEAAMRKLGQEIGR